MIVKVAC